MRQYLGTVILALAGAAVAVTGVAAHWPWKWPVWTYLTIFFLAGAVLSLPVKAKPRSRPRTFISGDASGSAFGNVDSDADVFVSGDARHALFWNIIHRQEPEC